MERIYSQHLGLITDEQFQAALDHFQLGCFIRAEPILFGLFGQNVFVSSSEGEFVLRGRPHFWWPFPVESDPLLVGTPTTTITYSQQVKARLLHMLAKAHAINAAATTEDDIRWVKECIEEAGEGLNDTFEPCIVLEDYKRENLVVLKEGEEWRVSGVFDLMGAHFGDGESDLSRQYAVYLDEDPQLAREFLRGYLSQTTLRPGFARRFPIYMLLDRAIIWEFIQRHEPQWWDGETVFRAWASEYIHLPAPPDSA